MARRPFRTPFFLLVGFFMAGCLGGVGQEVPRSGNAGADHSVYVALDGDDQSSGLEWPKPFNPSEVFVNPSRLDFRFKPEQADRFGIEHFDFEKVGLYLGEYRKSMPNKQEYRPAVKEKYKGVKSNGGTYDRAVINRRYADPAYLK